MPGVAARPSRPQLALVLTALALVLVLALAAPGGAATLGNIFSSDFEGNLCLWSSVLSPEACDGIDNDCDMVIDEDSVCGPCGDGIVLGSETCDDNNTIDADGCSSTCAIEVGWHCTGTPSVCLTECGDGAIAGSETCDDNNTIDADGCSSTCAIEVGWHCIGTPSVCLTECGDGVIVGSETCDDNNTIDADGCSAACTVEPGWQCSGQPSVCISI